MAMDMYEFRYERDGKTLHVSVVHADNETEALVRANAFFDKYPQYDPRGAGVTFRIGKVVMEGRQYTVTFQEPP